MAIAATSVMRPKGLGPKVTGLDNFHCIAGVHCSINY